MEQARNHTNKTLRDTEITIEDIDKIDHLKNLSPEQKLELILLVNEISFALYLLNRPGYE